MKKRVLLFLSAFVMLFVLGLVFKSFITASIFDTWAAYSTTSPNITIDAYPPDLIVDSPTSTDYSTTNLIDINYSVSDSASGVDTVWYNLDGGANTTLTGNASVRLPHNNYVLYVYANDTAGLLNGSESVSFSISSESFKHVNFSRFDVPTTTNFSALNDTQLEDITGLTLEITSYGKIIFSENINISEDTSLDNNIDISQDSIYINSNALPNFNKPATLQLYGLTFTDPRILKDGVVCPASICTEVNYSGGTLEFTVTGFTNYSAEETPTVPTPGPTGQAAGGGGGGGGAISKVSSFEVDKDLIKVSLAPGSTKRDSLTIKNTGETALDFSIDLAGLEEFVIFTGGVGVYNLRLEPGEEQTVQLIFNVADDKEPGVYPGKIVVSADSLQKTVTTIVEVESEKALFDIALSILPESRYVFPGETVTTEIKLFNLFGKGRVDVHIDFGIKDLNGQLITSGSTIVAVETQMSFVESLIIPSSLKPGIYVFYTESKYNGVVSTSSDTFEVVQKPVITAGLPTVQIVLLAIIFLILLVIVLVLRSILINMRMGVKRYEGAEEKISMEEFEKEKRLKEEKPKVIRKPEEKKVKEEIKVEEKPEKKIRPDFVENIIKIRKRMKKND